MTPPSSTPCREGNEAGVLDLHKRVSRRIHNFLTNSKSADQVAAEVLQMAGEYHAASTQPPPLSDEGD